MTKLKHLTMEQLEAGLEEIRRSPQDRGELKMIVRRPKPGEREVIDRAELDLVEGLVGDNWRSRGNSRTPDGSADPEAQITIINTRLIALIAQSEDRWPLAGDQLYIDLDLSEDNLPPGTRLSIGTAEVEVTATPHTGCDLFMERYGRAAVKFVNSPQGRALKLRGINTKIIQPGEIKVGDIAQKI